MSNTSGGWRWGPFMMRVPFLHTRLHWPEFLQGVFVATATGLALVPILEAYFGMNFEQAVTCSLLYSLLIISSLHTFGEPYAPGWNTPALPLVLAYVIAGYPDPVQRFQVMTALSLMFAGLVFVLGLSPRHRPFRWKASTTRRAGFFLGAAIAAFKKVFVDDAEKFLLQQPIATTLACLVCLVFVFSAPFQKLKARHKSLMLLASLGLLPGFIAAAVVGPLVGEVHYDIQWGWLVPPVSETIAKMSPFAIGWPTAAMFLQAIPLVLIAYVIQFGDIVTGTEVLREARPSRPDDPVDVNIRRSHLALGFRNAISAVVAPFFTTQGMLWTGVHVVIVQRWKQGPGAMRDLNSGLISYYLMGLPFIYFLLPLLTGLRPLLGIALSLTLILTGFACAYIAMAIPRTNASRGTALLIGVALALFEPWIGLAIGILASLLLVGFEREESIVEAAPE